MCLVGSQMSACSSRLDPRAPLPPGPPSRAGRPSHHAGDAPCSPLPPVPQEKLVRGTRDRSGRWIWRVSVVRRKTETEPVVIADSSQDSQSRLPYSITSFLFSQKEKTLHELIQDRWLAYTPEGRIGLGIRSFLDLRSWFRGNDIPSCVVCNEAGIKASTCPSEGCNVRMHNYCLKKKFSQRKATRACPGCATEWPRQEGEDDADEDVNDPGEGQEIPSAQPAERSSRKKRKAVKAELVEDAEEAGPSTAMPRRSSRSAKADAAEQASTAGASQPARSSKRRKK